MFFCTVENILFLNIGEKCRFYRKFNCTLFMVRINYLFVLYKTASLFPTARCEKCVITILFAYVYTRYSLNDYEIKIGTKTYYDESIIRHFTWGVFTL